MNTPPPAPPRLVECAGCGTRERLVVDEPDVVQLPLNWRRVGLRRDGSHIIYCAACYKADGAYRDR